MRLKLACKNLIVCSETIELRLRQETQMEPTLDETPADELTLKSVDERIKQATDPVVRRVEKLCALLPNGTETEAACNTEVAGSRRNRESSNPCATVMINC